ncbi:MAG: hypothetical protein HOV68_13595 [Streptomycetaceae bacterium]|nr:hypothetical protein [Streptomycetaceae bacterium]
MKKLLESLGFALAVFGLAGVVHALAGWFRLWAVVHRIPVLRDHVMPASIAMLAVGLAVLVLSDLVPEPK